MSARTESQKLTDNLLMGLLGLDVVLMLWAWGYPQSWAEAFHGTLLIDPHGFLARMGANWLAFAILQGLALFKWKRDPMWLLLVAGARFGDALTDWTYLAAADSKTAFAVLALGAAGPANVVAGWLLVKSYRRSIGRS